MNNGVNSVEDIDAMLDSEFNITEDGAEGVEETNEDDNEAVTNSEDNTSTNVDDDENETDDGQEDDENGSDDGTKNQNETNNTKEGQEKPSVDDKKDYAFSQLRKENAELKAKYKASSEKEDMLKNIALQYGYSDVNKFISDYEDARVMQEAKTKGVDPVMYKKLQDSDKRIAQLEEQARQRDITERTIQFRNAVEKAVTDFNLGEKGRTEIFTKLEEAGFTVDNILSLPNPEIVIKGILSDKIAEISKQKQIEKLETLDNLSDSKHDGSSSTKTLTVDDLIAEDMKEYKANNFYN